MKPGDSVYLPGRGQPGRVVEVEELWGEKYCRIWLPEQGTVVRVREEEVVPLSCYPAGRSFHHLIYVAAAARIEDALGKGVLLAPLEAKVIPLPHQLHALARAVSGRRVRYLLADEVGLGKTIEAGLIMQELKQRGLVRRVLVVAPRGLVNQWVSEMRLHFNEEFRLILPEDLPVLRRLAGGSPWRYYDQIVVPMDAVKPVEKRRGWGKERVEEYNRERFEDLIAAGWDLVVVDEAHRLGGSTEQVARYRLGQGLAGAAPYLLLLSATPHQGKSDSFYRLLTLLDPQAFPDRESVTRERVKAYVIRTEKRQAVDLEGKPLFQPRSTRLFPVAWEERHREQRLLYEAITEYVRQGYNQALREKKNYIGFLMILMQRLVTSSTRAIRTALERRLQVLTTPGENFTRFPELGEEDWHDLDGQEQLNLVLNFALKALKNEEEEVKKLLALARRTEAAGPDAKAEALLHLIYRLQQEEADLALKILVFTEFVSTQEMLRDFFQERGFNVVCLNGSMNLEERQRVQDAFAADARILISTDAGGEGLNLQFCHVVVNYDIPWNPMRLEQRIGRVDRIGQKKPVRAINFVLEGTVEHRVQEVLQEKLAIIQREFGVDKTADVLDSARAEEIFDDLYLKTLLSPEELKERAEMLVEQLREQIRQARENMAFLEGEHPDPEGARQLIDQRVEYWLEVMTLSFLKAHGGNVIQRERGWDLLWPDGEMMTEVTFRASDQEAAPSLRYVNLNEPRLRKLLKPSPFLPGQPFFRLRMPDLPASVRGYWALWRVGLETVDGSWRQQRLVPLFLHDDGRVLLPTARHIWDRLVGGQVGEAEIFREGETAAEVCQRLREAAERYTRAVYEELRGEHRTFLQREEEKGEYAFAARRRVIERLGLPTVRSYRLARLAEEEEQWREQLEKKRKTLPELDLLALAYVEGGT